MKNYNIPKISEAYDDILPIDEYYRYVGYYECYLDLLNDKNADDLELSKSKKRLKYFYSRLLNRHIKRIRENMILQFVSTHPIAFQDEDDNTVYTIKQNDIVKVINIDRDNWILTILIKGVLEKITFELLEFMKII